MSDTISNALSGLQTESRRLENAANNIANMNTSGFHARRLGQSGGSTDRVTLSSQAIAQSQGNTGDASSEPSDVDPARESVELLTARDSFAAGVDVLKAEAEMTHRALDIVA